MYLFKKIWRDVKWMCIPHREQKSKELFEAVKHNDLERTTNALKKIHPNIVKRYPNKPITPLLCAVRTKNPQLVELLVNHKAPPSTVFLKTKSSKVEVASPLLMCVRLHIIAEEKTQDVENLQEIYNMLRGHNGDQMYFDLIADDFKILDGVLDVYGPHENDYEYLIDMETALSSNFWLIEKSIEYHRCYKDKKVSAQIEKMEAQFKRDQLYKLAVDNATPAAPRISKM